MGALARLEVAERLRRLKPCAPGLLVAVVAALAATQLSSVLAIPPTVAALMLGLSLSFLRHHEFLLPGLHIAATYLLRIGVTLLAFQISLGDIGQLGFGLIGAVVGNTALIVLGMIAIGRLIGVSRSASLVSAAAVAICGTSAALAVSAVLGEKRVSKGTTAAVLVSISLLSATAMIAYPVLARWLGLNDQQAGFLAGAAIHDIATAVAAGFAFSPLAGQFGLIVKMFRVSLLIPLLIAARLAVGRSDDGTKPAFPYFVLVFFLIPVATLVIPLPASFAIILPACGSELLLCALGASAILSPVDEILESGFSRFLAILAGSALALGGALLAAYVLLA